MPTDAGSGDLLEIQSTDGTLLGVQRVGKGPPLLAVHRGTADRTRWAPVMDSLSEWFTFYLLDRRGRGASLRESKAPYALAREAEDAASVIESISEPTFYLGHSYGALIGMETLPLTNTISKALLYEPPFDTPGHTLVPKAFFDTFSQLLADGDREQALELFYNDVIGIDPAPLRSLPIWQARLAAVHTLEREGRIGLNYRCDPERYTAVTAPVRLLLGTESPPALKAAAQAATTAIPGSELVELPGQGHGMIDADPNGFVEEVLDYFEQ